MDFQTAQTRTQTSGPPAYVEYAWYLSLAYATLGQAWGIVIPVIGGALVFLVTVVSIYHVREHVWAVYAPAALALCTAISILAISHLFYNGQSLEGAVVFVGWLCSLIIVQPLSLRAGFLQRFAIAAFVIGLASLPLANLRSAGGIVRVYGGGGISNPNVLAMWFGFCTVYFIFWGLQCRSATARAISWSIAIGCLFVVFLTVSRGAVLAIILACGVGLSSAVKRYTVPILLLISLLWITYESGLFQPLINQFVERGAEESGRERLWPAALERIFDSPWVGVGLDNIRIRYSKNRLVNPHNALLHITLAGGILPLICFLGYLARVGKGCLRLMGRSDSTEAFLLPPMTAYGSFQIMMNDYNFMSAWVVVVFALVTANTALLPPYTKSRKFET